MIKTVTWTLGNGKVATYTVELQLTREINCDGDKDMISCCRINARCEVEGVNTYISDDIELLTREESVKYPGTYAKIGRKIGVRKEVYDEITAALAEIKAQPEWVAHEAAMGKNKKARKEYDKHYARMLSVMGE